MDDPLNAKALLEYLLNSPMPLNDPQVKNIVEKELSLDRLVINVGPERLLRIHTELQKSLRGVHNEQEVVEQYKIALDDLLAQVKRIRNRER